MVKTLFLTQLRQRGVAVVGTVQTRPRRAMVKMAVQAAAQAGQGLAGPGRLGRGTMVLARLPQMPMDQAAAVLARRGLDQMAAVSSATAAMAGRLMWPGLISPMAAAAAAVALTVPRQAAQAAQAAGQQLLQGRRQTAIRERMGLAAAGRLRVVHLAGATVQAATAVTGL
jgi:hypothetical protein